MLAAEPGVEAKPPSSRHCFQAGYSKKTKNKIMVSYRADIEQRMSIIQANNLFAHRL